MSKQEKGKGIPPGPRHDEVEQFKLLLLGTIVVELLFTASVMIGPLTIAAFLLLLLASILFKVGPPTMESTIWVIIASIFVVPLFYLRRWLHRRFSEVQSQLEQISPPDSSREKHA